MAPLLPTGISIFALTLFLDALELSFGRILWFMRTLRFWLYFILHLILSVAAAYLLREKIATWYVLAPVATFLAVAVVSNTDVKVGGLPLLPIAQLFTSIQKKMYDQAAEDAASRKTNQLVRALLFERLQKLSVAKIEAAHRAALVAAGRGARHVLAMQARAQTEAGGNPENYKTLLIEQLLGANLEYVQQNIAQWEKP